jgi:hypothetical protein
MIWIAHASHSVMLASAAMASVPVTTVTVRGDGWRLRARRGRRSTARYAQKRGRRSTAQLRAQRAEAVDGRWQSVHPVLEQRTTYASSAGRRLLE